MFEERLRVESPRLWQGEFDEPDHALSRTGARLYFLRAIRKVYPAVLETLAGEPLESFRAAGLHEYHFRTLGSVWRDIEADEIPESEPLLAPLRERLLKWAERWNLDDDWFRARLLHTRGLVLQARNVRRPEMVLRLADLGARVLVWVALQS